MNSPSRSLMVVAFHQFLGSRLFVTVALDMPRDGSARVGRSVAPPGLVHILPMSPHPLPVQPASSSGDNFPAADRQLHGAARR